MFEIINDLYFYKEFFSLSRLKSLNMVFTLFCKLLRDSQYRFNEINL